MTVSPGAVTAAAREIGTPVLDATVPAPAAASTRRKVPSNSENSRRHSLEGSAKSVIQCWSARLAKPVSGTPADGLVGGSDGIMLASMHPGIGSRHQDHRLRAYQYQGRTI